MEDDRVHSYNPHQPPPPQPQPSKAATIGIWVIVAWLVGPALLLVLCCAGCFGLGGLSAVSS